MKNPLKLTLLLLALLLPATTIAHDFEVDGIQYSIISESTVKLTNCPKCTDATIMNGDYHYTHMMDIVIPSHVSYNQVDYTVIAIGDSAFYNNNYSHDDYYDSNDVLCYTITIPETVTYIGKKAFGGTPYFINIICYTETPPIIDESFEESSVVHLYVLEDSYELFEEINRDFHYFDLIEIFDGQRSAKPTGRLKEIHNPDGNAYGFYVEINPKDNRRILNRVIDTSFTSTYSGSWNVNDNNYFYYESDSYYPHTIILEVFAVEDGKAPSRPILFSCTVIEIKPDYYFDFWDQNSKLAYNILDNNQVEVTRCDYSSYYYDDEGYSYSGNIIIPNVVCYQDYEHNIKTYYPVTQIGEGAFAGCEYLTSISIPNSITYIGEDAFAECNGLTKVNITDIASWCNIGFEIGNRSNPLVYAHHLYLNDSLVTDLIIPNSVDTIAAIAFEECSSLKSVFIPHSIVIEAQAFYNCMNLNKVTIGNTVSTICGWAFRNCPNLTMIKCLGKTPATLSEYYDDFDECVYQNATLYVPIDAVEAYRNAEGWRNFQNIVGFYDYEFESDGVYYKVTGENEVVVSSGEEAYSGNVVIPETVTVDGVTYTVTGIGSVAFANDSLNFLTIPVSVTANIASDAFEGCFVPSVYIIGEGAWADGALPASVDTLYISGSVTGVEGLQVNPSVIYSYAAVPPTCDENSFTGYDAQLNVPASSLAAYFTAPYWSNFINIVGGAVEPTGLSLDNDSISILVGNLMTLSATVTPDNATPQQVFWSSTDSSIAKVGPINGELTALKAGECDIKATLLDKTVVCHVTVTEIAPTEVTLSQNFAKLEIGSQLTLTATVLPEDATDKVISWTTTNSEVASVDSLGNVMAVGPGECFITASCRDKQAMCHVIVVEHFIYITLDEHRLSLLPNHMEWLTPTVTPVSTDLVVTSSNPSVAAARMANGKIQVVGITEGTTIIKVNSVDGYAEADSCRVTVRTQRGDVNYDGFINITDVTMMISQLMSAQSESYYDINADVNNDGEVNISDVTRLISHLMTGAELEPKDENPIIYETFTVNGVSFKMIKVEGGTFMMGATEEEDADYQVFKGSPKHQVTLSDYSIGETEVTQELWIAVMGSNPSANTGDLLRPVENVNWNDCDTFIMRLNALTGKEFRLPSEAEWEFAAHGGNLTQGYIYAGSDSIDEVAWYIANSDNVTHPVATKVPNELGLYDMNGNAEEWCNDWYYLYTEEPVTNPTGPETGKSRIHRGGRYSGTIKFCRISRRDGFVPGVRRNYMGLRLAM